MLLKPDPTFYPSAKLAMQAPAEGVAYVAAVQRNGQPDALRVVDLDPHSPTYGQCVHTLTLPYAGDELHHFGWNACSSALCPYAPHPYLERRYLIVPGLRSSRLRKPCQSYAPVPSVGRRRSSPGARRGSCPDEKYAVACRDT